MELDNITPLFTEEQIRAMVQLKAQSFSREDGANLLTAAVERAKRLFPDIGGDELMPEAVRQAYLRGYSHGIRTASASWMDDDGFHEVRD